MLSLFELSLSDEEVVGMDMLEVPPERPWQEPELVPVLHVRRGPLTAWRFLHDADDPRVGQ
jgi:hypothetical protein